QLRLPEPEFGRGELGALDDEALGPRCAGNRPAPCWRTHREVEVTGLPDRALRVLPEELEAEGAGPIGGGASGAPAELRRILGEAGEPDASDDRGEAGQHLAEIRLLHEHRAVSCERAAVLPGRAAGHGDVVFRVQPAVFATA